MPSRWYPIRFIIHWDIHLWARESTHIVDLFELVKDGRMCEYTTVLVSLVCNAIQTVNELWQRHRIVGAMLAVAKALQIRALCSCKIASSHMRQIKDQDVSGFHRLRGLHSNNIRDIGVAAWNTQCCLFVPVASISASL